MYTCELVPEWIIDENSDEVLVWFSTMRNGHNRKAFSFPFKIDIDLQLAEAVGMILGDGDMHRVEKRHFTYASKDADLSLFVLNFLRDRLFVKNKDITFTLQYRDITPEVNKLADILDIDEKMVKIRFSERHNYPTLQMQVNGVVFRSVLEKLVNNFIQSDFLTNPKLRRGFLRGLFAAEGCVGIQYSEMYINQIEFALSEKEIDLLTLLEAALAHEEIIFKKVYYSKTHHVSVIIQNWKNYLKCWNIGLFDRCARKKAKFLSVVRDSKVFAVVDSSDLKKLSERYSQRDLAVLIGSWQGNVCRVLQGKFLLTLRQIKILEEKGFNFSIKKLRIGNLTELPWNEETKGLFATS